MSYPVKKGKTNVQIVVTDCNLQLATIHVNNKHTSIQFIHIHAELLRGRNYEK